MSSTAARTNSGEGVIVLRLCRQ